MARVDGAGVHATSLADHIAALQARFRARFGDDLALDPETPQAQIIGIMALALAETDEALVAIGNAGSLDHASGAQLDTLGSLLDIGRAQETHSQVTATLTGVAGTTVPVGSRARTAANDEFATLSAAALSPAGVEVEMQAIESGPVPAAAGALSEIVTVIPGWETVRNPSAASLGTLAESDTAFRARYRVRTAHSSVAPLEALRAALAEAGATAVRVVENATDAAIAIQQWGIAPHSILAVVEGGSDGDIARALINHRGMGVGIVSAISGAQVAAANLAALDAVSAGAVEFDGTDYTGLDLTSATDSDAKAAALSTLLASANVRAHFEWITDGYFVATFPWGFGGLPAFGAGTVETDFGLAPSVAIGAPGPFVRPRVRALTIAADVTVLAGFPSDGLDRMRRNVADRVAAYGIGEQVWSNDILGAIEGVAGTRATSLTVQEAGRDISGVAVPIDVRWALTAANLTVTLAFA